MQPTVRLPLRPELHNAAWPIVIDWLRTDATRAMHQLDVNDDVNDDIIDDTIETVLQHGGTTIIVNNGILQQHQHIAAILRYSPTERAEPTMKTSHRIAATILTAAALAGCATDSGDLDNDPPEENVTTDPTDEVDDESED